MPAYPFRRVRTLLAALTLSAASILPAGGASAEGLFGFLSGFGQPAQAAPPPALYPAYPSGPMELRVRPRRVVQRPAAPRRSSVASRDAVLRQKEAYARLDPATNPDWYLQDPTLRRGDIVVLKTGIMVFEGQREPAHVAADFRPLDQDSRLSKADRQSLGKVATAD